MWNNFSCGFFEKRKIFSFHNEIFQIFVILATEFNFLLLFGIRVHSSEGFWMKGGLHRKKSNFNRF